MNHFTISLPIVLYCYKICKESVWTNNYLSKPCSGYEPLTLIMTLMVMHLSSCAHINEYQGYYQQYVAIISGNFTIYGATTLRVFLSAISRSMLTWKLLLLQRRLIQAHAPEILEDDEISTLDLDSTALVSYTNKREGSEFGHSKRFPGKQLLQLAASFIGKVFVDCKLFPGNANCTNFLQKQVKRAGKLGYSFIAVRADALYGHVKNLRFLQSLSLWYAIGISTGLTALKKARKQFVQLAKTGSTKIVHISKGVALLDLGLVNVAKRGTAEYLARVILVRRIHRRKKNGKWKYKTYFYGIVTNLDWTPRQVFHYYHKRQRIENGFKELRYHYHLNAFCKNGKDSLKANEFWITSKIFAMTIYKIFAQNFLSVRLKTRRLGSLLLDLFGKTVSHIKNCKVVLHARHKHLWHLRRIYNKLEQDTFLIKPYKIVV